MQFGPRFHNGKPVCPFDKYVQASLSKYYISPACSHFAMSKYSYFQLTSPTHYRPENNSNYSSFIVKSLRLLVETAKHVEVATYERLAEVSFGKLGFNLISLAMFVMSYGAMVGYMMIIKTNLTHLLGLGGDNVELSRAVLAVSSLCIILPLSLQRDMSNLAKTSTISVMFDFFLVGIVACFSPVSETVAKSGGWSNLISSSIPDISTFFTGIGVLCFAFVCQHSAFIIAASLEKPTRSRWNKVTGMALTTCAILASVMGVTGYIGFMDDTDGDILVNMGQASMQASEAFQRATNVGRGLLCTTMFLVYPMELFVARHVCIVLLFKGRRAHEGDDHSILARRDRRVALTVFLYLISLIPAMIFDDLGNVFSVTGSLGGSVLSYIGPGLTFIAVHGADFLELSARRWDIPQFKKIATPATPRRILHPTDIESGEESQERVPKNILCKIFDDILWYVLLMPIWMRVATTGRDSLKKHKEDEALKSPMPLALGKVAHHKRAEGRSLMRPMQFSSNYDFDNDEKKPLIRTFSSPQIKDKIVIQTKFESSATLPPLAPTRKGKVGFLLGPSHSSANEKTALDRRKPITPDNFSSASFEVLRENNDSYGSVKNTILQEELREIRRENSGNLSEIGDSSLSHRSDDGLTYDGDDESKSHGSSIFVDRDDEVSSHESGESSVHVDTVRSIQNARQNVRVVDEIPKTLSMDKIKVHPLVKERMSARGNVSSIVQVGGKQDEEEDPQDEMPSVFDFALAMFYVIFGFVAAFAGLYSSML